MTLVIHDLSKEEAAAFDFKGSGLYLITVG